MKVDKKNSRLFEANITPTTPRVQPLSADIEHVVKYLKRHPNKIMGCLLLARLPINKADIANLDRRC